MSIAQLRNPTVGDVNGHIVRILWRKAQTYENDTMGAAEAADLKLRADLARMELNARGEGIMPIGEETEAQEEELMDGLVAGYFR